MAFPDTHLDQDGPAGHPIWIGGGPGIYQMPQQAGDHSVQGSQVYTWATDEHPKLGAVYSPGTEADLVPRSLGDTQVLY